jgi:hypothetical protein
MILLEKEVITMVSFRSKQEMGNPYPWPPKM